MDYGAFVLFGLSLLLLIIGAITVVVLYIMRHPFRGYSFRLLMAGVVLVSFFGRGIYQSYVLDDGLFGAVLSGNTPQVKSFLARGANPNRAQGEDGTSAMAEARHDGHADIVELLRKAGARDK